MAKRTPVPRSLLDARTIGHIQGPMDDIGQYQATYKVKATRANLDLGLFPSREAAIKAVRDKDKESRQ